MKSASLDLLLRIGFVGVLVVASSVSNALNEERARIDYTNYCAACHGLDGKGNGPMASELKGVPTNLTTLTE